MQNLVVLSVHLWCLQVLAQYNKSVICFENTLKIQPDFKAATDRRHAVLCHAKLEAALEVQHRYHALLLLVLVLFEKTTFSQIKYLYDNTIHDFTPTADIFVTKPGNLQ